MVIGDHGHHTVNVQLIVTVESRRDIDTVTVLHLRMVDRNVMVTTNNQVIVTHIDVQVRNIHYSYFSS